MYGRGQQNIAADTSLQWNKLFLKNDLKNIVKQLLQWNKFVLENEKKYCQAIITPMK